LENSQQQGHKITGNIGFSDRTLQIEGCRGSEVVNDIEQSHRKKHKRIKAEDLKVTFVEGELDESPEEAKERMERASRILLDGIIRVIEEQRKEEAQEKKEQPEKQAEERTASLVVSKSAKPKPKQKPNRIESSVSQDFIQETVEFWSKKYGRPISREDARQIIENVTGFFSTLDELDRKRKG